jgi:aldehyde dehydrogenase (NAD+)
MPVQPVSMTSAPSTTKPKYTGFDGQYIDGAWRPGKQGSKLSDTDPYSGEVLAEIVQADKEDLDQAYRAAASAQVAWAAATPITRANIMFRSAQIMEERHAEIVDWIVRESGSTIVKAEIEWQFVYSVTLEAASFPHRVSGNILPLDEAG